MCGNLVMKGKSLEEVHESIPAPSKGSVWRKILAFFGPAYLISVGYMDPGNWATDIAGGSQFGYSLLWVLLMSNIMALLLQSLSARLGIVTRRDLAQASRETYPKFVNYILWVLAEIAIAACDLAEILGMAIGLNLLFGISLMDGVLITVVDTFLLLFLINKGMRKMEAFIIALVAIIGFSFVFEMFFAQPDLAEVATGLIPSIPNETALYIAIGIIGATVMPHNLYLHSSLVQTRKFDRSPSGIKQALKYNFIDSAIALNLAFLVNAAILILAATAFYKNGMFEVAEIQDAHRLLEPMLGTDLAPILFAVALIAAGQSSTITGTLAGQIVMEGYLNLRIQPWVRRIITRLIAILPAVIAIYIFGEQVTGKLLIFSQVVLSMQLGFAIIPLIHFVSDKRKMNGFHISKTTRIASWLIAIVIILLNARLVYGEIRDWLQVIEQPLWIWLGVVPLCAAFSGLLIYIIFEPLFRRKNREVRHLSQLRALQIDSEAKVRSRRIAIAVDFSGADENAISHAVSIGGNQAEYTLIHVVETIGAKIYGQQIKDRETALDQQGLDDYAQMMRQKGYNANTKLAFGVAWRGIAAVVNEGDFDLLIMGTHGHTGIKDLIFGTTVNRVRHRIGIPLLLVKEEQT